MSKKSSKGKLIGMAWTAGAVVVGLVVYAFAGGDQKVQEVKEKLAE